MYPVRRPKELGSSVGTTNTLSRRNLFSYGISRERSQLEEIQVIYNAAIVVKKKNPELKALASQMML